MMSYANDEMMRAWPALIGRLRFLMNLDRSQFAGHLGCDIPTVLSWEQGISVPDGKIQKTLRDKLYRLEPAISLRVIEAMPVISAVHFNSELQLCCAASQPYADTYGMRASELRYSSIGKFWGDSLDQAAEALARNEAWKSGECAYVRSTTLRPDGRWVHFAGSPIGIQDMALWIGALTRKPRLPQESDFDLSVTSLDELLLD